MTKVFAEVSLKIFLGGNKD